MTTRKDIERAELIGHVLVIAVAIVALLATVAVIAKIHAGVAP